MSLSHKKTKRSADGPTYSNVPEDTDADRPVLVTADGPTYINMPEDTGEQSSDGEPLIKIAKVSQQIGSCNSPEVVTVSDLFGPEIVAVLRLPLLVT